MRTHTHTHIRSLAEGQNCPDSVLMVSPRLCVLTHLVVPESRVAAHTLLHADVSKVAVPLATGLWNQLVVVEQPEETLLKVLRAANAAAAKLHRGTQQGSEGWPAPGGPQSHAPPHRAHDGVPGGGEDLGAVVATVVTLQLAAEIISGQLEVSRGSVTMVTSREEEPKLKPEQRTCSLKRNAKMAAANSDRKMKRMSMKN